MNTITEKIKMHGADLARSGIEQPAEYVEHIVKLTQENEKLKNILKVFIYPDAYDTGETERITHEARRLCD